MIISCLIIKTSTRQGGGVKTSSALMSCLAFQTSTRQGGGVNPQAYFQAAWPSRPPSDRMEEKKP